MTVPDWAPMALAATLALTVAGIVLLITTSGERKEGVVGRHDWLTDRDIDDSGGDVELLAAVTGLGEERDTGAQARVDAAELPVEGWELRGGRDVDPGVGNPWRTS